MTLSAVPTGLKQLVRALFPSLERLGYCHSVPLGQQDVLILLGALRTSNKKTSVSRGMSPSGGLPMNHGLEARATFILLGPLGFGSSTVTILIDYSSSPFGSLTLHTQHL